ncbi:BURP domain-containing protein 3-like [Punica granatum]|uniref:BURP domain-containing protein 3-like n=1 Tax=Punica granatum TaxID=22663 RepID=A0A218WYT1_PUNGR|nr:BURP domain-containing protein 3-like [Punica granatum]OWM77706.1 hypothetical protein CDL15_Pgr012408 [Punica granatum]
MNLLWAILAGHSSKGMELAGQHNESAREPPSRQLMSRYGQQVAAKEHGEAQGSLSTIDKKIVMSDRKMKVYSAAGTRVSDDEGWSLFFAEDDLHPGKTMSMRFIKSTNPVSFLPQKEAAFMPFSSRRLSEIFRLYSGKSGSAEAQKISYTIERCLGPSLVSTEDTSCVMSLESMVDFATTRLGNNLQVFNTEVKEQAVGKQDYTIQSRIKKVEGDRLAVCHKLHYPYAVFTCHSFKSTDSYPIVVPVKGPDGTTTEAIAVCHENTSEQNPEPLKMLNIKPGIVPLCHFLARDSIVYAPRA